MTGANSSEQSFSNRVGTGSRLQVFAGQDEIRSNKVLTDTLSQVNNLSVIISVCKQESQVQVKTMGLSNSFHA